MRGQLSTQTDGFGRLGDSSFLRQPTPTPPLPDSGGQKSLGPWPISLLFSRAQLADVGAAPSQALPPLLRLHLPLLPSGEKQVARQGDIPLGVTGPKTLLTLIAIRFFPSNTVNLLLLFSKLI